MVGLGGGFELTGSELEGYFWVMDMLYICIKMVVARVQLFEHVKLNT